MKVRFQSVLQNQKFVMDGNEWTRTNYFRAWRVVNKKKEIIRIKKAKLVEVN